MWSGIGCVVFGCLLIHAWWFETYTDSPLARSWRRMSAALSPTRNAQAMLRPCVGLWFFFGGIALLLEPIGAPCLYCEGSALHRFVSACGRGRVFVAVSSASFC